MLRDKGHYSCQKGCGKKRSGHIALKAMRPKNLYLFAAAAIFFVLVPDSPGRDIPEPVLSADFNRSLNVKTGTGNIEAVSAAEARFIPSPEGHGIEPGKAGPAVTIRVPDKLWPVSGAISFYFRPSRTVCTRWPSKGLKTVLVKTPLFLLGLTEESTRVLFTAQMEKNRYGRAYLNHLKGGRWYHVLFTWNPEKGRKEFYLNGEKQEALHFEIRNAKVKEPPWIETPWAAPEIISGDMELGGTFGEGDDLCRFAVDSVKIYSGFMGEDTAAALFKKAHIFPLSGEGIKDYSENFDLSAFRLIPVFEENFDSPLNMVHENDLFDGNRRIKKPEGREWVLEGKASAWTENGLCIVRSLDNDIVKNHAVLWNTREFPSDILIEFGIIPYNRENGLAIIFFANRNRQGGSPFDLWTEKRDGHFRRYTSGQLNGYHISYWAGNRRSVRMRKNNEGVSFQEAVGIDRIHNGGPPPYKVRILKTGGVVRVETNGKLALKYDDDENRGPICKGGWIGLRHMGFSEQVIYTHFRVWKVEKKR